MPCEEEQGAKYMRASEDEMRIFFDLYNNWKELLQQNNIEENENITPKLYLLDLSRNIHHKILLELQKTVGKNNFLIKKLYAETTLNSFPVIRAHALRSAAVAGSSEIKSTSCPISDSLIFLLNSIIGSGHLLPRQSSSRTMLIFP